MKLLDLFCGAGGAAEGYRRAGFTEIVGVDIDPQPSYPFEFIQADVFDWWEDGIERGFDLVHASPPCQAFTIYGNNRKHVRQDHPNLIPPTRNLLKGKVPYVMENVPRAPLENPIQLCGTSFGIRVRRHRLFEVGGFPVNPPPCDHGRFTDRIYPGSTNRPNGRTVCNVGEWRVPLDQQREAMDIDWMSVKELSQAIPPAYTEHIGKAFISWMWD